MNIIKGKTVHRAASKSTPTFRIVQIHCQQGTYADVDGEGTQIRDVSEGRIRPRNHKIGEIFSLSPPRLSFFSLPDSRPAFLKKTTEEEGMFLVSISFLFFIELFLSPIFYFISFHFSFSFFRFFVFHILLRFFVFRSFSFFVSLFRFSIFVFCFFVFHFLFFIFRFIFRFSI